MHQEGSQEGPLVSEMYPLATILPDTSLSLAFLTWPGFFTSHLHHCLIPTALIHSLSHPGSGCNPHDSAKKTVRSSVPLKSLRVRRLRRVLSTVPLAAWVAFSTADPPNPCPVQKHSLLSSCVIQRSFNRPFTFLTSYPQHPLQLAFYTTRLGISITQSLTVDFFHSQGSVNDAHN